MAATPCHPQPVAGTLSSCLKLLLQAYPASQAELRLRSFHAGPVSPPHASPAACHLRRRSLRGLGPKGWGSRMVLLRSGHGLGGLGYAATLPCRQPWAAPHLALQRPQSTRTAWVGRPLVRRLGVAVAASRLGRRRSLRCTARLTSSRDSLDEEQLEGLLPQGHQNGRPSAAAGSRDTAAAAAAASPLAPPQCAVDVPACGEAWQARQLSIKELQKLTELHIEDAYRCGVVSCAPELAACLGTNLSDGLCESQASPRRCHGCCCVLLRIAACTAACAVLPHSCRCSSRWDARSRGSLRHACLCPHC